MRAAAILTGVETHLDHLGVLSSILGIGLIVTQERVYTLAKKYYPHVDVILKPLEELTLDYLAFHFDVLFETGKFWAQDLAPTLELLYGKKMRFVFSPHGNSDKGHSLNELVCQDISLVYGEHLLNLLKHNGAFNKIKHVIRTGNYRLSYYLSHRAFYQKIIDREITGRFCSKRAMILYAPTWNSREHPTSFFSATEAIIQQLGSDFNLLIKLHPFLIEHHPAHVFALTSRYEAHPAVVFLQDFPLIYPLLENSVCYIGDYSSIGYDYLSFDRPLFFLKNAPLSTDYTSPLYSCGEVIFQKDIDQLKGKILKTLQEKPDPYSPMRQKTYFYTFDQEITPDRLRKEIFETLARGSA